MNLDKIQEMVAVFVRETGETPRTLLLTPDDAKALHIPFWTRQLLGMKVVIAANWQKSQVTDHVYETVIPRKADPKDLAEYQKQQEAKIKELN